MIDGGNDETRVGERLGHIVKAEKGAASAVRNDDERQLVAADLAILCHG
jgi:hypothetical protein